VFSPAAAADATRLVWQLLVLRYVTCGHVTSDARDFTIIASISTGTELRSLVDTDDYAQAV